MTESAAFRPLGKKHEALEAREVQIPATENIYFTHANNRSSCGPHDWCHKYRLLL